MSEQGVVDHLVARIAELDLDAGRRVAIDGAPPTGPGGLADALVDPLRALGRAVVRVSAATFLRQASVRLERGRTDADAYYDDWLDTQALTREVLAPMGPQGTGRYLPTLWDVTRDRATREPYRQAPTRAVLVLDGSLLLGRGLEVDLTVHLSLRPATLRRRLPPEELWTAPAFERYAAQARPEETADVVVRADDPRRPAVLTRA